MKDNVTEDGTNHTAATHEFYCTTGLYGIHQKIIISALNIPLSITAFLGNFLIIVALQKPSSLHPPSKLLFGCLAITDLCVGLITQPLFVSYLVSPEHSKRCYHLIILLYTIGGVFCGVSFFTLTAISVDRLLSLLLGLRYRQVVTLRRVRIFVIIFWIFSGAIAMTFFYDLRFCIGTISIVLLLCLLTSSICYTKIYLTLRHHQTQVQDHVHQGQPDGGEIPLNITRYRKTVSSALWVQITSLACYLPYGLVVAIVVIAGLRTPSLDLAVDATLSLLLFNSTLNPFLYCWKIREVRQAVKDTITHLCCLSG